MLDKRGAYILQVQFSVFIDALAYFDPSEFNIIVCRASFWCLECFDCLLALPSLLSNEKLSELGFLFSPVEIMKPFLKFKKATNQIQIINKSYSINYKNHVWIVTSETISCLLLKLCLTLYPYCLLLVIHSTFRASTIMDIHFWFGRIKQNICHPFCFNLTDQNPMHEKPRHENTWQERYKHDNNKGDVIVIIIVVSLCNHLPNNPELQKWNALEIIRGALK